MRYMWPVAGHFREPLLWRGGTGMGSACSRLFFASQAPDRRRPWGPLMAMGGQLVGIWWSPSAVCGWESTLIQVSVQAATWNTEGLFGYQLRAQCSLPNFCSGFVRPISILTHWPRGRRIWAANMAYVPF